MCMDTCPDMYAILLRPYIRTPLQSWSVNLGHNTASLTEAFRSSCNTYPFMALGELYWYVLSVSRLTLTETSDSGGQTTGF